MTQRRLNPTYPAALARLRRATPQRHAAAEAAFIDALRTQYEALISSDPAALAVLAEAAPLELLRTPANAQLLRYYRGLGAGLADRPIAALAALTALLGEPDLEPWLRGRTLNSAAVFAQSTGNYQQASAWYHASLAVWEQLGDAQRLGVARLNLGIMAYELQEYAAAEAHLHASAALFATSPQPYRQGQVAIELGLLARDQGRWDAARAALIEAVEHFTAAEAPDAAGRAHNNLGEVAMLCGDYRAALDQFELARQLMTTRAHQPDISLNRGLIAQATDDRPSAAILYAQALQQALAAERHEVVPLLRYRLAHAQRHNGELAAARQNLDAAVTQIEAARAPLRDESLLLSLMGRWQLVYEAAVDLCLAQEDPAAAFGYAERARARAFADLLSRDPALGSAEASAAPVSAAAIQRQIPPDTVLIVFCALGLRGPEAELLAAMPPAAQCLREQLTLPPQLLRFTVTRSALGVTRCPIDPHAFQATNPHQQDGRRFLRASTLRGAAAALLGDLTDQIRAAQQLIIVPHGPLHQLPFCALPGPDGAPLLRGPALSYTPSATVLARAVVNGPSALPCLALSYAGDSGTLPHADAEARTVAELCGGVWHSGAGAAAVLREQGGAARWLHLACHGAFDLADPLRSWLEIGPGERLTAAEVLRELRLSADLVVLSACRSGVSQVLRGDEPLGLVRAFLGAGARAVLVTLWEVEDAAARALMTSFYRALIGGLYPDAALQQAQRALQTSAEWHAAEHWAGYALVTSTLSSSVVSTAVSTPANSASPY